MSRIGARLSEATRQRQNAYGRAYYRALYRLARAHPAEFGQLLDDERNAPARRAVLEQATAGKRRRA